MADVGPTPECPCGASFSEERKNALNWGRTNPVFQNPMLDRISNAQGAFADSKAKVDNVIGALGSLPGANVGQLQTLSNTVGNMQGILANYANESNRLSGLPFTGGGPDLLSLVSTVAAAVNFQCALGIEGLDVGVGIGLMNENGKLQLNVALNVNADLTKILGKLDGLLGGAGSELMDAVNGLAADIGNIVSAIDSIAGEINGALSAVSQMYNDALDFINQFTSINFALDFAIDECTKFGVGFQQGILNPDFIQQAKAANPLNRAQNPGFGSTFR